ncbi:HAMP domain-containing sensor histidine kinase [Mycolicibacterium sp. 050158]|uniref:sensor histidine kinase n=1 Tax=Mycolicibacterium sp. 050158 TaxID=3090602 RepID=UPI00299DF8A5|nr:HAMP domain-containing sensor histidine kinase [Mycolicibacterium sp. 050158]MDX1891859.1 HAMP domain-containing sensor histidine kinase [Mycolicibacterium sp. 050158]
MTPAAHASPWWRPRTLSRQVTYGVSALVTVVVFGIGALSVYSLHTYVTTMGDAEVSHSLAAFEHSFKKMRTYEALGTGGSVDGDALQDFTGQAPGTVIAVVRDGHVVDSAVFSDDDTEAAPAEVKAPIESADWDHGATRSLKLGDMGHYRARAVDVGDGEHLVSAVSMESANEVVARKTVAVVLLTVAAALIAAIGTVVILRQALRPLRRVAATAAKAANMPLADEDHRITTRVRRADSNPDNEVGIVGETLNRLLANVDSALAARAASDRRMRRFLTDASHELRTPLTAIQGYAELTRQEAADLPPTTEYALARIESEARRMTALVGDMLLLSRLDEGQGLDTRPLDLRRLVIDAVNDAEVSAPEHRWETDLPDAPVQLLGDEARLRQVLGNLLSNATFHTPAGTTVRTALVTVEDADGLGVELTVTDDGPGIDRKLLPELFGRFVRGSSSRAGEETSTGLGLAIVASIVAAHGGTVGARSEAGLTEFRIVLPAGTR